MRHKLTETQISMLFQRAERQLLQILEHAASEDPSARHIAKVSHPAFHETVVGLVTLFRDNMSGTADIATQIARAYAGGADARAGAPTLACVHEIVRIARHARDRCVPPSHR